MTSVSARYWCYKQASYMYLPRHFAIFSFPSKVLLMLSCFVKWLLSVDLPFVPKRTNGKLRTRLWSQCQSWKIKAEALTNRLVWSVDTCKKRAKKGKAGVPQFRDKDTQLEELHTGGSSENSIGDILRGLSVEGTTFGITELLISKNKSLRCFGQFPGLLSG